jgi:hypothetical protein
LQPSLYPGNTAAGASHFPFWDFAASTSFLLDGQEPPPVKELWMIVNRSRGQQAMQRPASVTVFGILNIVFAGLGIFGLLSSLVVMALPAQQNNPALQLMRDSPVLHAWSLVAIPLGLLSVVALLVSGIGLLNFQSWARKLAIAYGFYAIVLGIIGQVISFLFLYRPLLELAQRLRGPEAAGVMGGLIGGIFGGCLGFVYPVLLIIFMMRPQVVAACRAPDQGAPAVPDDWT